MKNKLILTSCILLYASCLFSATLKVPQEYSSIQLAVNEALDGDTVLVDTGVYYENIVFRGNDIVLTSYYFIRDDFNVIFNTIIDGSQPETDTTNVVSIINGESPAATLEGFTIRGGVPGVTVDLEGQFPEGGGLMVRYASPEIKYNYFTGNGSTTITSYNGGGGMSTSYSNAEIHNNIFFRNGAGAGGAFIDNNSSVRFYNNLVVANRSTAMWGGIVLSYNDPANPFDTSYYYNNTIVGNINITGYSIGVLQSAGNKVLMARNNIVHGNASLESQHIKTRLSGEVNAAYNNFPPDNYPADNIAVNPHFIPEQFFLGENSPCVDAGDPSPEFLDREDPAVADEPLFPARGTLLNDLGCYGGPSTSPFTIMYGAEIFTFTRSITLRDSVGGMTTFDLRIFNTGADTLYIDSVRTGNPAIELSGMSGKIPAFDEDTLILSWEVQQSGFSDTLKIYHNGAYERNPQIIVLKGEVLTIDGWNANTREPSMQVYPNPADAELNVIPGSAEPGRLELLTPDGKVLFSRSIEAGETFRFSTHKLKNGIYYLRFTSGEVRTVRPISVLH